jgi:hypothetical protein
METYWRRERVVGLYLLHCPSTVPPRIAVFIACLVLLAGGEVIDVGAGAGAGVWQVVMTMALIEVCCSKARKSLMMFVPSLPRKLQSCVDVSDGSA